MSKRRNNWEIHIGGRGKRLAVTATFTVGKQVHSAQLFARREFPSSYTPADWGLGEYKKSEFIDLHRIEPAASDAPPGGETACLEWLIGDADTRGNHIVAEVMPEHGDEKRVVRFLERFGFQKLKHSIAPHPLMFRPSPRHRMKI